MGDFKRLAVWQKGHVLSLAVYRATVRFPGSERFGLTAQIRRAAVSVISNLAEGCGRGTDRELARYCRIARGSVNELECQILLARDLGYLEPTTWRELDEQTKTVSAMLRILASSLENRHP